LTIYIQSIPWSFRSTLVWMENLWMINVVELVVTYYILFFKFKSLITSNILSLAIFQENCLIHLLVILIWTLATRFLFTNKYIVLNLIERWFINMNIHQLVEFFYWKSKNPTILNCCNLLSFFQIKLLYTNGKLARKVVKTTHLSTQMGVTVRRWI